MEDYNAGGGNTHLQVTDGGREERIIRKDAWNISALTIITDQTVKNIMKK